MALTAHTFYCKNILLYFLGGLYFTHMELENPVTHHNTETCPHCRQKYPRVEYHSDHKRTLHSQYIATSMYYGAWEGEDGAVVWVKKQPQPLTDSAEVEAEALWRAHVAYHQAEHNRYWNSDEGKAHAAFMATATGGKYA